MDTTSSSEQTSTIVASPPRTDWKEIAHHAVEHHRAIQHSGELAFLLTVADTAQVKTVLEIGCFAGGTAWAFAQLPSVDRVITVDRDPQAEAYPTIAALAPKAVMVKGESEAAATMAEVRQLLDGTPPDLLFIDASHDLQSVNRDWMNYHPMVRVGGLVALHDVEVHAGRPDVEVHLLWEHIRSAYPSVKITASPGEWAGIGIIWR